MLTGVTTAMVLSPTSSYFAPYTSFLRTESVTPMDPAMGYGAIALMVAALVALPMYLTQQDKSFSTEDKKKALGGIIAGVMSAAGLAISGMVLPSKLYTFLNFSDIAAGTWDPTLVTVLGSAIPISMISYQWVPNFGLFNNKKWALNHPINASTFKVPTNRVIDYNLVMGEAIFGIGWGIGLLCPGPALYHIAVGNPMVVLRWLPAFIVGSTIASEMKCKQP
jgi:hypothetical protein